MTQWNRREMIAASGAALLFPGQLQAQVSPEPFSWDGLIARARALSRTPYRDVPPHPGAAAVDYDALHKAQFRPERALWADRPGATRVRFFPLSGTASQPVFLHEVEDGRARPIAYDPAMFAMEPGNPVAKLGPQAGFAGFRVMNAAQDGDWLVFMGASYFRSSGAQKQYGLSARAVAIDTSVGPEEFPRFTHFWLERTGDASLTVHALLDGPSIAGAFRFRNRIDADGVQQDVDAALFPRRAIRELGLMPMTSMFWYDQAHRAHDPRATDWRPEIHDSDGLAFHDRSGGRHFRPLVNPHAPRTSIFDERNPGGFGLLQRDRSFDHYQDDGVFYERRPSLWATPNRPLGTGNIRLYEFPTDSEYTDNIASYWTPAAPVAAGRRIDLSYRLDWRSRAPALAPPLATVENIWRGASDAGGNANSGALRFVADFAGLPAGARPTPWADLSGGTLIKSAAYPIIGHANAWRSVLDIAPLTREAVDIRLQLRSGDTPLSEMLHYPLLS